VENYYDENGATLRIKLNPAISPAANAQKYYKDYQKAKNAEIFLTEQIQKGEQELEYLDSVLDTVSRAETERELSQIREELTEQGYLRKPKGKQAKQSALPPLEFTSSDGFTILVGRNNRQNDRLTLKTAAKTDLWLHTKDIHGSHVIIVSGGREITETAILEAARLAAYHSKARHSTNVPVDYTLVRHVSKPAGAKPGMVIYVNNRTVYVDPLGVVSG
jgi:predicted ribosome quality control (RQC) complex YloA/Tae2 family protein